VYQSKSPGSKGFVNHSQERVGEIEMIQRQNLMMNMLLDSNCIVISFRIRFNKTKFKRVKCSISISLVPLGETSVCLLCKSSKYHFCNC
jgi:hypothetical protein